MARRDFTNAMSKRRRSDESWLRSSATASPENYYQYFYDPHDEVSFNAELSRRVTEQYRHSPATFAKCAAEKFVSFWFAGKTKTSTLLNVAVQLPYLVLGLVGLALGFRRADPALLACLLLFVVYSEAVYADPCPGPL